VLDQDNRRYTEVPTSWEPWQGSLTLPRWALASEARRRPTRVLWHSSCRLAPAPLRPLISAEALAARVAELGREINQKIPDGELTLVGVLRGAFVFMADLVRALPRDVRCDFLGVRSYGDSTMSSGVVEITSDLLLPVEGQHVLLVEDIVDTGLTLQYLMSLLEARRPRSLHVCTLLSKPSRRRVEVPVDFIGFEVPDQFVVGYGLDAAQRYRGLPYIGVLEDGAP
jgi:hypoxanthine phosphoribosyltransferase